MRKGRPGSDVSWWGLAMLLVVVVLMMLVVGVRVGRVRSKGGGRRKRSHGAPTTQHDWQRWGEVAAVSGRERDGGRGETEREEGEEGASRRESAPSAGRKRPTTLGSIRQGDHAGPVQSRRVCELTLPRAF